MSMGLYGVCVSDLLKMVVGEGKRRRITVVLGCGPGREGGFGDERLWEFWGGGADPWADQVNRPTGTLFRP